MPRTLLVWWGYFVEISAAALILILLCLIFGQATIATFVCNVALDAATLFSGIMFAASLAFLWTFYSKSDTEFYRWLDENGAFNIYLGATGYAVAVNAITTLALVGMKHIQSNAFALFATYLLLLAILNLFTLVQNVFGLMRLNTKFNRKKQGS